MTRQELIPIVNNAIKDYERVIIMIKGQNLKVCFYILTKNNMLFGLCRYFSCTLGDYWVPLKGFINKFCEKSIYSKWCRYSCEAESNEELDALLLYRINKLKQILNELQRDRTGV